MSLNPEQTAILGDLENKAGWMSLLTKTNKVRMPRFEASTVIGQTALDLHIRSIRVQGQENLEQGLNEAQKQKKRTIFTLRHRADADTFAFRKGMVNSGYRDVINNTVYIAGVNMLRRPYILPFSFSEEVVYIATPEDLEAGQKLHSLDLTLMERRRVEWVNNMFREMNEKAKIQVEEVIGEGRSLGVYPEGGRSKDSLLRRPPRRVSIYFLTPREKDAVVIPVVINGTDEINRPGESWGPDRMLPENRKDLEIIIGTSYSSLEVWTWPDPRKGKNRNPADWVVANLANTYPFGIREEDYLYFEAIIRSFKPERNRMALAA